jgi:outer membrane protein assembly factor BamD (BamD/ComL family)
LLEAAELAQRSGMPALALERLETLIQRYPEAELAHNAEVERFRLLASLGRKSEAAAAARQYLKQRPHGFAHAEAESLLETLGTAGP